MPVPQGSVRRFAARAVLVCAVLSSVPAIAQRPDASFRRGVQAADRGEWGVAEREMRQAIQLDSRESRRKISITGMRYEMYLPYYYLGLALYRRGDLVGARTAWNESRSQRVILGWRDSEIFSQQWQEVVAAIGPPPPPRSPPPPQSPRELLASAVSRLKGLVQTMGPPTTPVIDELVEAAEVLDRVRQTEDGNYAESDATLSALVPLVEAAEKRLRSALGKRHRRVEEVIRDLRTLVGRLREKSSSDAGIEEILVEVEIELARNAPDVAVLERHEAALLKVLHPILASSS